MYPFDKRSVPLFPLLYRGEQWEQTFLSLFPYLGNKRGQMGTDFVFPLKTLFLPKGQTYIKKPFFTSRKKGQKRPLFPRLGNRLKGGGFYTK